MVESAPASAHLRTLRVHYSFTMEARIGLLVGTGGVSHAPPVNLARAVARLPHLRELALSHDSPRPLSSVYALSEADVLALSCSCPRLRALRCDLPWVLSREAESSFLAALPNLCVFELTGLLRPPTLGLDAWHPLTASLVALSGLSDDDWEAVAPLLTRLQAATLPASCLEPVLTTLPLPATVHTLQVTAVEGEPPMTVPWLSMPPSMGVLRKFDSGESLCCLANVLLLLRSCPCLDTVSCRLVYQAAIDSSEPLPPRSADPSSATGAQSPGSSSLRSLQLAFHSAPTPITYYSTAVLSIAALCPGLQHLRYYGPVVNDWVVALPPLCPALVEFNIRGRLNDDALQALTPLPLTTLSCGVIQAPVSRLRSFFAAHPSLTSLRASIDSTAALEAICSSCRAMRSLRLGWSGDDEPEPHPQRLEQALVTLPSLVHVRVRGRLDAATWVRVMARCRSLRLVEAQLLEPADQRALDKVFESHHVTYRFS
jgi:hypothetical protein